MLSKKTIFFVLISVLFSFKSMETAEGTIEKIYTQTDRSLYFPGDTIWFKSYITNAEGKATVISEYMYAQLISPKGTVISQINLDVKEGYAYGDYEIDSNWVGGIYKLRMFTNWMQNFGESAFFEKEITVQKVISPNLLMSLDFQKQAYGSNAEVIADFELKDLKNKAISSKEIQYTVQIKGEKGKVKKATTDLNGKLEIGFTLPSNLQTTDVILTVLVPHKGAIESISRSVPVTLENLDLQFFPESGSAIIGIDNVIAFKALNEFGKPASVSGTIVDDKGRFVSDFKSFHDGMGSFSIKPTSAQYFAKISTPFKSDSLIALPKILIKGTTIRVTENQENFQITMFSNEYKQLSLSIATAYRELKRLPIKLSNNKSVFTLAKNQLPNGILKLSLQDPTSSILAERLVFANKHKQLNIAITLVKEIYKTREKVTVKIKTTSDLNTAIPANVSVSVVDNKLVYFANDKQDNILSYLLMSSELQGKIHKPSFYFKPEEIKAKNGLDNIMLTHGWRNYLYQPILVENAKFHPQVKSVQHIKVIDHNNKGVACQLLLFNEYTDEVLKYRTDKDGLFSFKMKENSSYVLIAYNNTKSKLSIIKQHLDKTGNQSINNTALKSENKEDKTFNKIKKPLSKTIKEEVIIANPVAISLEEDSEQLDEIVIVGYGSQKKKALSGAVTIIEEKSISTTSIDNIGQLLQGRVAGVEITETPSTAGNTSNIAIRGISTISGNSQPLFVIDGVAFNQNDLGKGALLSIEPANIESIHVLKGAAASSLFGSNGSNGVVIINTIDDNFNAYYGSKLLNNKRFKNYTAETFIHYKSKTFVSKEFYMPVYNGKESVNNRDDFRETIYWNPVIQTDRNGDASFEFYNSDVISSFIITTEGVGSNGLIGRDETTFATKKQLHIDFKTPNYMAINDTVNLAIRLTNESSKQIQSKLAIILPAELKRVFPLTDKSLTIAPNSEKIIDFAVVPIKKAKEAVISVSVAGSAFRDKIDKKINIISPYFPTQATISGNKNETYEFIVNDVVDGSLEANFSVYTDIVGNVMDGVASLIRQPYGCFEQLSSSTYPNILILKYLKQTNKSNPKIEKKALNFIKSGYKKLAAYETKQDGFEWYGNTPPHEALSAYGLMEFIEMKEVYAGVNDKMIKRTINYLLSRKDGKGGFKQNSGKYGFSSAPENVNNAYIIYALSETKLELAIEKEYNVTFKEALNSEDTYRMALMACASYNLNKVEDFQHLMVKIKSNIEKSGFKDLAVENTITRSYGNAKTIETAAFTILALLKEGSDELASQGTEYILSQSTNGRFGSTQSTSMALKALIAYSKVQQQKIIQGNALEIDINGHKINKALSQNEEGKVVIKNLEKYIKEGKQKVSVRFANSKNRFPYMLNIKWDSKVPDSSKECKLSLETQIKSPKSSVGETIRMDIHITNKTNNPLPMATAIIGIPSGTAAQPWQLKEILEQQKADYFEVFDNYLVFYWKEFNVLESKTISLDLKAEVSGNYQAPASTVYLYYADEFKHWISGNKVKIE